MGRYVLFCSIHDLILPVTWPTHAILIQEKYSFRKIQYFFYDLLTNVLLTNLPNCSSHGRTALRHVQDQFVRSEKSKNNNPTAVTARGNLALSQVGRVTRDMITNARAAKRSHPRQSVSLLRVT